MSTREEAIQRIEEIQAPLVAEIARLRALLAEVERALTGLVGGIDRWNESVQQIIGRVPGYSWPELSTARTLITKIRAEREGREEDTK